MSSHKTAATVAHTIGIDTGKNTLHLIGLDDKGAIAICARSSCRAPRVILLRPANWAKHSFGLWLTAAAQRLHHNVLATALANKLARIAWTVLAQGRSYQARVQPKVA
jgi:hypothetical protein